MADAIIPGIDLKASAVSTMDTLTIVIYVLIPLIILGMLFWLWMYYRKFNKIVIIKDYTSGVPRIIRDKARLYKNKLNAEFWQLWAEKDKIRRNLPIPSPKALELTNKGSLVVSCIRMPSGEVSYIEGAKTFEEIKDLAVMKGYQPVTTADRMVLCEQVALAKQEEGTTGWALFEKSVPIIALVLILIIMVAGWDTFTKPMIQSQENYITIQRQNIEMMKLIENIDLRIQHIEGVNTNAIQQNQAPPP